MVIRISRRPGLWSRPLALYSREPTHVNARHRVDYSRSLPRLTTPDRTTGRTTWTNSTPIISRGTPFDQDSDGDSLFRVPRFFRSRGPSPNWTTVAPKVRRRLGHPRTGYRTRGIRRVTDSVG